VQRETVETVAIAVLCILALSVAAATLESSTAGGDGGGLVGDLLEWLPIPDPMAQERSADAGVAPAEAGEHGAGATIEGDGGERRSADAADQADLGAAGGVQEGEGAADRTERHPGVLEPLDPIGRGVPLEGDDEDGAAVGADRVGDGGSQRPAAGEQTQLRGHRAQRRGAPAGWQISRTPRSWMKATISMTRG